MIDELLEQFHRARLLPDACKLELSDALKGMMIAKGNLVVAQRGIYDQMFFIVAGLLRGSYIIHEKEYTTRFFTEGQTVFISPHDWTNERLEAVEDTVLYALDYKEMARLGLSYPEFLLLIHDYLQKDIAYETQRHIAFRSLNAYGRWLWFLGNHSRLMNRLSPRQIASYLGFSLRTFYQSKKSATSITV